MIFKNTNGVLSILTELEDIIKANGYFGAVPQHLYLVSKREIRDRDFFINIKSGDIDRAGKRGYVAGGLQPTCYAKIEATNDKSLGLPFIDEAFLKEWISDQNMKIKIETEREDSSPWYRAGGGPVSDLQVPKTKADNTVIIISTAKAIKTSWGAEDLESLVLFTKHLEYMDGSKAQHEFTPGEIIKQWLNKNY